MWFWLIAFLFSWHTTDGAKKCLLTNDCTPLDEYVWRPDDSYTYSHLATYPMDGYTTYILNMTSQTWFNAAIHSRPVWVHYMTVHIPDIVNYGEEALLFISKGDNDEAPPDATGDYHIRRTGELTNKTGIISATIHQVPNQPLQFYANDTLLERREDGIIAYTWRIFAEEFTANKSTLGPDFLLSQPTTKAAIRAMDTITSFVQTLHPSTNISRFLVAGESKRGWTTWTTAATDDRVIAQIPIVFTCLNMVPNYNHYWRANGGWSFGLIDYWAEYLMGLLNYPHTQALADIIDPYTYRNRYTIPSYVITASSDEIFMNDDHHYFLKDMPSGYFLHWIMENTRHEIVNSPIVDEFWRSIQSFALSVVTGWQMPQPRWMRNETTTHGSITVYCDDITPLRVTSFWAPSPDPTKRDWRVVYGFPNIAERNVTWFEEPVVDLGDNTYQVEMDIPAEGWIAFYIKLHYQGPPGAHNNELTITTEASIIPDVFPFPQCNGFDECQGILV